MLKNKYIIFALVAVVFLSTGCQKESQYESYDSWANEYAPSIMENIFDFACHGNKACFVNSDSRLVVLDWLSGEYTISTQRKHHVEIMDDDKVYFSHNHAVFAVEIETGNVMWKHTVSNDDENLGNDLILYNDLILVSTGIGFPKASHACVIALDKNTGKTLWRYQLNGFINSHLIVIDDCLNFWYTKGGGGTCPEYSLVYRLNLKTQEIMGRFRTPDLSFFYYKVVGDHFYTSTCDGFVNVKVIPDKEKYIILSSSIFSSSDILYADKESIIKGNGNDILKGYYDNICFSKWTFENPHREENEKNDLKLTGLSKVGNNKMAIASEKRLFEFSTNTQKYKEIARIDLGEYRHSMKGFCYIYKRLYPKGISNPPEFKRVESFSSENSIDLIDKKNNQKQIEETKDELEQMEIVWKLPINKPETKPYKPHVPLYTVRNNVLYTIDGTSIIEAVDMINGEVLWEYQTSSPIKSRLQVDENFLYYTCEENVAYSIDLNTRKIQWEYVLPAIETFPQRWQSTLLYKNLFLMNVMNVWDWSYEDHDSENYHVGNVVAIDKKTGKELWRYNTEELIDSNFYVEGGYLYLSSFFKVTSEENSFWMADGKGWFYKINLQNQKVIESEFEGPMFNQPWYFVNPYFYSSHRDGNAYRLDTKTMEVEKLFDGNIETVDSERPDCQVLKFANNDMFIRGNGPFDAYSGKTLESVWSCNLPNGLKSFTNFVSLNNDEILIIDENSNFYVVNVHNGKMLHSYSFPMQVEHFQIIEKHNDSILLEATYENQSYLVKVKCDM